MLLCGNWKMNRGVRETREFFLSVEASWKNLSPAAQSALQSQKLKTILFPPALSLTAALEGARGKPIQIGSQNTHGEAHGAFTGELSGAMLSEIGITASLVGHSERRQYYGETPESAAHRAKALLAQSFTVIFCVGETRAEREAQKTLAVIDAQLAPLLPALSKTPDLGKNLIVAYEPVWAIGTGLTATPEQAQEVHAELQKRLPSKTPTLYGGSVTPTNLASLLAQPAIHGALVGGASVKPDSYLQLLEIAAQGLKS